MHPNLLDQISLMESSSNPHTLMTWTYHPLGRNMFKSMFFISIVNLICRIKHYEKLGDIQTLAVIACVIESQEVFYMENDKVRAPESQSKYSSVPKTNYKFGNSNQTHLLLDNHTLLMCDEYRYVLNWK